VKVTAEAEYRGFEAPAVHTRAPRALILHAPGTNRDREAALACTLAGAEPEIGRLEQLQRGGRRMLDYHMLVLPGGFAYGDALGAGTLWALDLRTWLHEDLERVVGSGRPVLGICNGFQVLVKAGLLPGLDLAPAGTRVVTLSENESSRFECRWVYLQANTRNSCLFTEGLDELIHCPVAHGEGCLVTSDAAILDALFARNLVAFTYTAEDRAPAGYPANPSGAAGGIAGLCNKAGNVLGMMPHPEDHIFPWQHPGRHRGAFGQSGLPIFANMVRHA
jgi:phosphoribosylformylglycinamidine synthase